MYVRHIIHRTQESLKAVNQCNKPVIAAIHGHRLGAGINLLFSCDIRYTSRDALSILPEFITNHSYFHELVYTPHTFSSDEAQQTGSVSHIYHTHDNVINAAIPLADTIAHKSPIAVQGSKISLNYARDHSTNENFNFTVSESIQIFTSYFIFIQKCA